MSPSRIRAALADVDDPAALAADTMLALLAVMCTVAAISAYVQGLNQLGTLWLIGAAAEVMLCDMDVGGDT